MPMFVRRAVLAFLAVLAGACPSSAQSRVAAKPNAGSELLYPRTDRLERDEQLAVLGDVQRTSFWGRLVLAETNLVEQRRLVGDLATQRFRGLVLLGDMVFSASDDNWSYFDQLMAPLRRDSSNAQGAEPSARWFFPVMGNHDYMGSRARVSQHMNQRFAGLLPQTHYAFDWHHVRMLVLDGNRSELCKRHELAARACDTEWQAQLGWLRAELRKVDEAPAGQQYAALLFVHQSPYTQSPLVAGDQADARDFAKELFDSQRGLALISAHAHGFERYAYRRDAADQRPAKVFIVSAGGGGPRPRWRRSGAPADLSRLSWPRPFNYLLLRQDANAVQIDVRGLEKGAELVTQLADEHVTMPFR